MDRERDGRKQRPSVEWYDNRGVKPANPTPSDETLKQAVRNSLDQDSRLVANEIAIRTYYGDVTLDGSVYSHYEKGIAEEDAKNVVGVAWVTNNLFVRADQRAGLGHRGRHPF